MLNLIQHLTLIGDYETLSSGRSPGVRRRYLLKNDKKGAFSERTLFVIWRPELMI